MEDPLWIIVYGLNELAPAVARKLRLAGHAVAVHEARPPNVLCRRGAFSDAWRDGAAALDGVEVRRAEGNAEFGGGLRGGAFIPLLTHPPLDVVGQWPCDIVIDARVDVEPAERRIFGSAELTIALGSGAVAGVDCDLVIETAGPDPGAVIRSGIGEIIAAGELLGAVEGRPVVVRRPGPVCGSQHSPRSVRIGDAIAELTPPEQDQVSGVDRTNRLIARSVAFTIDLELKWPAMRFEALKW